MSYKQDMFSIWSINQAFFSENMLHLFQKMHIKSNITDQNGIKAQKNIEQLQNVPNFLKKSEHKWLSSDWKSLIKGSTYISKNVL